MSGGKRLSPLLLRACAIFLAYGAAEVLFYLADAQSAREQSVAWFAVFSLVLLGYRYAAKEREKRGMLAAGIAAAVLAVCAVLGREISTAFRLGGVIGSAQNMLRFLWRVLCLTSVFYIPLVIYFSRAGKLGALPSARAGRTGLFGLSGVRGFVVIWAGILLCWLPYYLAFYPGIMNSDSLLQLEQALGTLPLSDAHPLMHTALIALCVKVSALLGAPSACVALYSGLQMLCLSAVYAYACTALSRWGPPRWATWGCCAFFAILPMHPLLSVTMWKDVPHAAATLLLVIQWMDCARDPKGFFASWKRLAALTATLFFFGTFRHNGFYVCLLSLPFFLWFFRAHWKRALAVCLAAAALLGVYRGPVLSALSPGRGSVTEFLSIPSQFVARTVVYRYTELSEEDKDIIREVLPYSELVNLYNPEIADPVKHSIDVEALQANPTRYASLLLRLALRYPALLLESFLCGNYGYWFPEAYYMITVYGLPDNSAGAVRRSIGIQDTQVRSWVEYKVGFTPGVSMIFSIGAMVWAVALAAALLAYKRRRDLLPPFLPLLFLWLSLLGSAVFAEYRYAYGIVVCMPVCMGAALAANARCKAC